VPLIDEAAKISCLAEFQELPLNLQAVALRRLIRLVRAHYAEVERQLRIQRAWFEYDLHERAAAEYDVIG